MKLFTKNVCMRSAYTNSTNSTLVVAGLYKDFWIKLHLGLVESHLKGSFEMLLC